MTGIKVALSAVGILGGGSSAITGIIVAQAPALTPDTQVNVTLALVGTGLATVAVLSWKVSRAWSKLENTISRLDERIAAVERNREEEPVVHAKHRS